MKTNNNSHSSDQIEIAEFGLTEDSQLAGHTLEELQFRQMHGVNDIGIQRGEEKITTINPEIQL